MRRYQLALIRAETVDTTSVTKGNIQGAMMSSGGRGMGFIQGAIDTILSTHLYFENRVYKLTQINGKLPVRPNDELLVVCTQAKNGEWNVVSAANLSNGTSFQHKTALAALWLWGVALFSLLTIFFLIGFVLAPFLIYQAWNFTARILPEIQDANHALATIVTMPSQERAAAIAAFNTSKVPLSRAPASPFTQPFQGPRSGFGPVDHDTP